MLEVKDASLPVTRAVTSLRLPASCGFGAGGTWGQVSRGLVPGVARKVVLTRASLPHWPRPVATAPPAELPSGLALGGLLSLPHPYLPMLTQSHLPWEPPGPLQGPFGIAAQAAI